VFFGYIFYYQYVFIVIKTSNCGIDLRLYYESKNGFEKKLLIKFD